MKRSPKGRIGGEDGTLSILQRVRQKVSVPVFASTTIATRKKAKHSQKERIAGIGGGILSRLLPVP